MEQRKTRDVSYIRSLKVDCPACGSGVGYRCTTKAGNDASAPHAERYALAREKFPPMKPPVETEFTPLAVPDEPVRHVIIEAVLQDSEWEDIVDNAVEELRSVGCAEIIDTTIVAENLTEADRILRNRIK